VTETVRLTLRAALPFRVAADAIAPDRFAACSAREIAALGLWPARRPEAAEDVGRAGLGVSSPRPPRSIPLAEIFAIEGERAASVVVCGDLRAVDGLGARMAGGSLLIEGDVGRETGRQMRGGRLTVRGNAGDQTGLAMSGGTIHVLGNAGDGLGAPLAGASSGMSGGEILVRGDVGRDAGAGVRRGLLVAGGSADTGAGRAMLAGTLVVMGRISGTVGEWNKRGSIIAGQGAPIPPTYRYACTFRPEYLRLVFMHLRASDFPVDERVATAPYARYCGDISQFGKGEILVAMPEGGAP